MANIRFINKALKEIEKKQSLFFDFFTDEEIPTQHFKRDLDVNIHETLLSLNDKPIESITISLSITDNFLEFSGLRLGHHVRLTEELTYREVPLIFIGSIDEKSLLKLTPLAYILLSPNVYYVDISKYNLYTVEESIKKRLKKTTCSSLIEKTLNTIKVEAPANYKSHHSVDNELALLRWSEYIGCVDEIPKDVKVGLQTGLYFKYYKALNPIPTIANKESLEIKGKGRVLLIDDEASKGWERFYNSFLSSNESIEFESLYADFKSTSQKEIIELAIQKVNDYDPDIVLLDLRLCDDDFGEDVKPEELTGCKILKTIKDLNKGIQVIITTASNKVWNYETVYNMGASAYSLKAKDSEVEEDMALLKESIEKSVCKANELKSIYVKFNEIFSLVERNNFSTEFQEGVERNMDICFELLIKSFDQEKYRNYTYLQLFLLVEEFLKEESVFVKRDKCYVVIKGLQYLVLSKDTGNTYTSALTYNEKGKYYEPTRGKFERPIDTNFKMSALLIFRYGFIKSTDRKVGWGNWKEISEIRNTKAAHPGKEIVSFDELKQIINFLIYLFNENNINDKNTSLV